MRSQAGRLVAVRNGGVIHQVTGETFAQPNVPARVTVLCGRELLKSRIEEASHGKACSQCVKAGME